MLPRFIKKPTTKKDAFVRSKETDAIRLYKKKNVETHSMRLILMLPRFIKSRQSKNNTFARSGDGCDPSLQLIILCIIVYSEKIFPLHLIGRYIPRLQASILRG